VLFAYPLPMDIKVSVPLTSPILGLTDLIAQLVRMRSPLAHSLCCLLY